jgi:hypothetical protein
MFASLRPRNCIMAGASGTYSVCVCTIHQNVKLMMEVFKISELTRSSEHHPFFHECGECPGPTDLENRISCFIKSLNQLLTFNVFNNTVHYYKDKHCNHVFVRLYYYMT